jgi:hypothetical protein
MFSRGALVTPFAIDRKHIQGFDLLNAPIGSTVTSDENDIARTGLPIYRISLRCRYDKINVFITFLASD